MVVAALRQCCFSVGASARRGENEEGLTEERMKQAWRRGKRLVDRSSVVSVISPRRVIDCHRTLNNEGLLLTELARRAQLVRKDNRWSLVG